MNSGNIWRYDHYKLRKYLYTPIDYFLDIGACVGTASVFFKSIVPFAKVIAIEPSIENYQILCAAAGAWDVKCYNIALGNGEKLCFDNEKRKLTSYRFYTLAEKEFWPKEPKYFVVSKTLPDMFAYLGIKGRYIIKIDAEGAERFLLEDNKAIEIIRNAIQFNVEIHLPFGGTIRGRDKGKAAERWDEWFDLFKNTHLLFGRAKGELDSNKECVYEPIEKLTKTWRRDYMLVKK